MTESEIRALLDAHDVMVKAYVDSSLGFDEFVSAYGDFPRNYGIVGDSGSFNRFLPEVGLRRIRELVARYPDFKAGPDVRT